MPFDQNTIQREFTRHSDLSKRKERKIFRGLGQSLKCDQIKQLTNVIYPGEESREDAFWCERVLREFLDAQGVALVETETDLSPLPFPLTHTLPPHFSVTEEERARQTSWSAHNCVADLLVLLAFRDRRPLSTLQSLDQLAQRVGSCFRVTRCVFSGQGILHLFPFLKGETAVTLDSLIPHVFHRDILSLYQEVMGHPWSKLTLLHQAFSVEAGETFLSASRITRGLEALNFLREHLTPDLAKSCTQTEFLFNSDQAWWTEAPDGNSVMVLPIHFLMMGPVQLGNPSGFFRAPQEWMDELHSLLPSLPLLASRDGMLLVFVMNLFRSVRIPQTLESLCTRPLIWRSNSPLISERDEKKPSIVTTTSMVDIFRGSMGDSFNWPKFLALFCLETFDDSSVPWNWCQALDLFSLSTDHPQPNSVTLSAVECGEMVGAVRSIRHPLFSLPGTREFFTFPERDPDDPNEIRKDTCFRLLHIISHGLISQATRPDFDQLTQPLVEYLKDLRSCHFVQWSEEEFWLWLLWCSCGVITPCPTGLCSRDQNEVPRFGWLAFLLDRGARFPSAFPQLEKAGFLTFSGCPLARTVFFADPDSTAPSKIDSSEQDSLDTVSLLLQCWIKRKDGSPCPFQVPDPLLRFLMQRFGARLDPSLADHQRLIQQLFSKPQQHLFLQEWSNALRALPNRHLWRTLVVSMHSHLDQVIKQNQDKVSDWQWFLNLVPESSDFEDVDTRKRKRFQVNLEVLGQISQLMMTQQALVV